MQFTFNDILKLLPELMLALLALLIIVGDPAGDVDDEQRFRDAASTATLGLGMIFVVVVLQSGYIIDRIVSPSLDATAVTQPVASVLLGLLRNLQSAQGTTLLNSALIVDELFMVSRLLFIGAALLTSLLLQDGPSIKRSSEFFGMLVLAVVGLNLMAGAGELVTMYVALELASVALYVLVGRARPRAASSRGLTYPLGGLVSSGVVVYGLSMVYGYAALGGMPNSTSIPAIAQAMGTGTASPFLIVSAVLMVVGMAYKLIAIPALAWDGDRAPALVTAFVATAAKAATFVMLFRIVGLGLQSLVGSAALASGFGGWSGVVAVVAVALMIAGNVVALRTRRATTILAGTAAAYAGVLLVSLVGAYTTGSQGQTGWSDFGVRSLIYGLLAYVIAMLGAWGTLAAISATVDEHIGLHRRNLGLAALFVLFVLSLAGVPPLSGFWARFFVLAAGWEADAEWLTVVGVITVVLSAVAYLRLLGMVFFDAPGDERPLGVGRGTRFALVVAAIFVVVMGMFPTLFLPVIQTVAQTPGAP